MGLDMYLEKRTYIKNWNFTEEKDKHEVTVKRGGEIRTDIKPERVTNIVEEVMYWRKANAIHKWFVDNVQDGNDNCGSYFVEHSQLEKLAELCEKVVITRNPEHLPTQEGFFFGSTDTDEYYFDQLKETADQIREILAEDDLSDYVSSFYYSSSW